MLGAVFSSLGAIIRNVEVGLFISSDGYGENRNLFSRGKRDLRK